MGTELLDNRSAQDMGALCFMSADLFAHFLTFLSPEDVARLAMTNQFFGALLDGRGYAWRQIYQRSPYFDPITFQNEENKGQACDWKALYIHDIQMGWRFDQAPNRCGEAFRLSKDRLTARVDKEYKGPVIVQRVATERGAYRGRHLFSVKVEGVSPGSTSFGVCPGRLNPPHGYISCIAMYAGDGTLDRMPHVTILQDGRIKRRVRTGYVVTIELDLDKHQVHFHVNGVRWVTLDGVENETKPTTWHFYVSIKNYYNPLYKDQFQVYRVTDPPTI